jgi:hypothetical protein
MSNHPEPRGERRPPAPGASRAWLWALMGAAVAALVGVVAWTRGEPERTALVAPPLGDTTEHVLATRGPDCLECAQQNGCLDPAQSGGACELASGPSKGCGAGVTETAICLKTLSDIFRSKCAAVGQEVPCLCGTTNTSRCFEGTDPPNGPILPDYTCDFGTTDVPKILANFKVPTFGAGQANALVQCLAQSECKCFRR